MRTSIQLWSLREPIRTHGFPATIERLDALGFTAIEPFGLAGTIEEIVATTSRLGMAAPTAHQELTAEELDAAFAAAHRLGVGTLVQPMFPAGFFAPDALASTADILNHAAARAAAEGLKVAVHNHDDEIRESIDGRPALLALVDLLDPAVGVEFDIYWSTVAGVDPVTLLEALGDRVTALHIKDGPLDSPNTAQTALGRGDLALEAILAAAPASAVAVLSLDMYQGEPFEAVAASRTWLTERGHA
ncbi:TIM barrel protein [Microbacteriaceae bacterium VKM Ac-2854]|nr:TIM barrel protein [Microbacteriaceae bacterium VKM Ac-2854]